jgi:hypothetical protein
MADSGKRKPDESDDSGLETRAKKPRSLPESQPSDSTLNQAGEDVESSEADEIFKSALATLRHFNSGRARPLKD